MHRTWTVPLFLLSASLVGCASESSSAPLSSDATLIEQTITTIAGDTDDLSTLVTALEVADLVETLEGEGPFTVFAPTNEAFAKLPEGELEALLEDEDALRDVLLYHVVPGELFAVDVLARESLETALGATISVQADGPTLNETIGLVATDIAAKNGVVHLIDMVLIPPTDDDEGEDDDSDSDDGDGDDDGEGDDDLLTIAEIAASDDRFETLVAALELTKLDATVSGDGPFTVFAPTDGAFDALPDDVLEDLFANPDELANILLYHVVPGALFAEDVVAADELTTALGPSITVQGEALTLNENVNLIITDIAASNGVIHVIDAVLLPPPPPAPKNIVEIAKSDDRFETLVAALKLTKLDAVLEGDGPFTVFAPTDDAFDALPEELLHELLDNPDALADILLYHVVPGALFAEDVVAADELATALGPSITVQGEALTLNENVNLIITDIVASNGVIHVIDAVLLPPPPPKNIVEIALEDERFTTLVDALHEAHLVDALQGEGPFTVFAPTNEAFERVPKLLRKLLFSNSHTLRNVLLYHVVPGDLASGDVLASEVLETLLGPDIEVDAKNATLNGHVNLIELDIVASNGVIHVIDSVLIPPLH
jgi:transforming growth factor-beta-induced protein